MKTNHCFHLLPNFFKQLCLALPVMAIFFSTASAQAVDFQVSLLGSPANTLEACAPARQLLVKIINYGPDSTLSTLHCTANLSNCVKITSHSANVSIDNSALPVVGFVINPTLVLAVGGSFAFTIDVQASCEAAANAACGGVQDFTASYQVGNSAPFSQQKDLILNVVYPALAITSVTPAILSFDSNGDACRTLTIKNGGFGAAYGFDLRDKHGQGISVTGIMDNGTSICINCTASLTTPARAHYNGILLPDDSVQIVECVHQDSCDSHNENHLSRLYMSWGCNVNGTLCKQVDDSLYSTAQITNLAYSLGQQWISKQFSGLATNDPIFNTSGCLEDAQVQEIKWWNPNPNSNLNNVFVYISSEPGITGIDINSIQIKHYFNDPYTHPPSLINSANTTAAICPESNVYYVSVNLGDLNPLDTVYLRWAYHNCQDTCSTSGYIMANKILVGYDIGNAICSQPFGYEWEYLYDYYGIYGAFSTINLTPSSIDVNTPFQGDILMTTGGISAILPNYGSTGTFGIDITTSANVTYNGSAANTSLMSWIIDGTTFHPNNITLSNSGHTIHADFLHPYNNSYTLYTTLYSNGITELLFPLIAACNGGNSDSIELSFYYRPDISCSYTLPYFCETYPIQVPACDTAGACSTSNMITLQSAKTYRQNVGTADINDDGGLDLPASPPNESLIRRDRFMYKDTLYSQMKGIIAGTDSFEYVYAIQNIDYGKYFDNLTDTLRVYDASTNTHYNCVANIIPVKDATASSLSATFTYNLYDFVSVVGSPLPANFRFGAGDSIDFRVTYRNEYGIWQNVNQSPYWDITPTSPPTVPPYSSYYQTHINSHFEGSPVANTDTSYNAPVCSSIENKLLGLSVYIHHDNLGGVGASNSCAISAYFNYSVSLGGLGYSNCNWFPYEHRPVFVLPNQITITKPVGYDYTGFSCQLSNTYYYPIGSGWAYFYLCNPTTITPLLTFDVRNCFEDKNGTIALSDEATYCSYAINFTKTGCTNNTVPTNWNVDFSYVEAQDTSVLMQFSVPTTLDPVQSSADIAITSPNQVQCGLQDTTIYEINVQDIAAWTTPNAFLYLNSTGLEIVKVEEIYGVTTTVLPVKFSNGLSKMYDITLSSLPYYFSVQYKIYVKSICNNDSLKVNIGWSCSPSPTTQAAYNAFACGKKTYNLYYCAAAAALQVLDATPNTNIDLCDTLEVVVKMRSAYEGYPHDISLKTVLPPNLQYVDNSSQMYYVDSAATMAWTPIDNPVSPAITWNLNNIFNQNHFEFPGVNAIDSNEIWIKFRVIPKCGYTSGSSINFQVNAKNPCNSAMPLVQTNTQPIRINGIINGNLLFPTVSVQAPNEYCGLDTLTLHAQVYNFTSDMTSNANYYEVTMPNDYFQSFVANSVSGNHLPAVLNPLISISGNFITLRWKLPALAPNSLVDFSFKMGINNDSISCENKNISCFATTADSLYCPIINDTCVVFAASGTSSAVFEVHLPYYSVSNVSFSNYPGSGQLIINALITKESTYSSEANQPVYIYCDVDSNGVISNVDVLLYTYNIASPISSNGTYQLSETITASCNSAQLIMKMGCACDIGTSNIVENTFLIPLPVESLVLEGETKQESNRLNFVGKGTQEGDVFELQKKDVDMSFTPLFSSTNSRFEYWDKNYACSDEYRVLITDINGNEAESNHVTLANSAVFIEVYPNPTQNILTLKLIGACTEVRAVEAVIYDKLGKKVMQKHFEGNTPVYEWNVSALAQGAYLLEVINEEGKKYQQFFAKE